MAKTSKTPSRYRNNNPYAQPLYIAKKITCIHESAKSTFRVIEGKHTLESSLWAKLQSVLIDIDHASAVRDMFHFGKGSLSRNSNVFLRGPYDRFCDHDLQCHRGNEADLFENLDITRAQGHSNGVLVDTAMTLDCS